MKKVKKRMGERVAALVRRVGRKREKEYSKRLLNRIVNHSICMMWGTYVLAWFDRVDIAESLSKTIATSIIAVVVGYLAKSVIENISKHTTAFGKHVPAAAESDDDPVVFDPSADAEPENEYRDC